MSRIKSETLRNLLQGEFICEFSAPDHHAWLTDEGNSKLASEFLAHVDLRLGHIEGSYCVLMIEGAGTMRDSAMAEMRDLDLDIFANVYQLLGLMRELPAPGDLISKPDLAKFLQESREAMEIACASVRMPSTDPDRVAADLIQMLISQKVILPSRTSLHQVTSKFDYFAAAMRSRLGER